ncbi:hypothetical protein AYO44_12855 [Planctomycetaceae bacterium SCGC AG-212-F19]|nr:hypothetical protein AYO44_12855 [Planctomycetaceae bacterium SCGC AG-212-F19]
MAAGEKLHKFDLQLCDYVVGTIHGHFDNPHFRCFIEARINPTPKPGVEDKIAGPLRSHLLDPESTEKHLLLNDRELDYLAVALADPGDVICSLAPSESRRGNTKGPPRHLCRATSSWVSCRGLHERPIYCVKEIQEELTKQDAEEWSKDSAAFAKKLENERLSLSEGIEIVHEWVDHVRRFLRAMGATHFLPVPEGTFPTPIHPTPAPPGFPSSGSTDGPPGLTAVERDALKRLRHAIEKNPKAKPEQLIEAARVQKQRGYQMLHWMQDHGQYAGLGAPRPSASRRRPRS